MRLFIADDNIPFRTRLASMLSGLEGIEVVGEAGDVAGAIELITRLKPDTIVLDIQMPGGSGFDVLRFVKAFSPLSKVIMLSVGSRSQYASISRHAGADYFFEKSSDLRTMARVLEGLVRSAGAAA